jgi:hypothetical protein
VPKQIQGSQTDFSFGEIDIALKRNDQHPARKAGLRQMENFRILNSGAVQNRSGRTALFPITAGLLRIEKFTISSGNDYKIGFGPGILQIIDETGTVVFTVRNQGNGAALPWISLSDIQSIVYCIMAEAIYITFGHSMRPQVVTWDGVSTWSISDYTELAIGSQKRTPFFRISPQNISITPSDTHGQTITVTASAPIFKPGMVGTRIRFVGRQILITGFTSPTVLGASVEESLPGSQVIEFLVDPSTTFDIGDEVIGSVTGSKGIITAIGSLTITVQLLSISSTTFTSETGQSNTVAFTAQDTVVGPAGGISVSSANSIGAPAGTSDWDEEVMNDFRGFPASCFVDQFRLGFCDFPSVPGGISWSAINSPTDLFVDVTGDNAIFELVPADARVQYVVPGPESSEFIFCDTKLYYIPISPTSPLAPGTVSFQVLSGDGCAQVQPKLSQEVILYANAGATAVMAIVATGAYLRPFNTKILTKFHQHLFSEIVTIAVPTADGQFNERYAYVLNADDSLVVGKYEIADITSAEPKIGWGPWTGNGDIKWVAAWEGEVHFTSFYFGFPICERLDDTLYLDSAVLVNAPSAPFVPPAGKGPLWFLPSQTVTLMDQVTRAMGTYKIDANGNIIPQFNGGENLEAATLVAGQPWTATVEPFAPDAPSGSDMHQRMLPRRISYFGAYVLNSTGFFLAKLFSSKQTPTSPPLGTIMNTRRVPAWNQGDDATKPPPLRETLEEWRPSGHSYDPRISIVKDTPGPLLIQEIAMEITI